MTGRKESVTRRSKKIICKRYEQSNNSIVKYLSPLFWLSNFGAKLTKGVGFRSFLAE